MATGGEGFGTERAGLAQGGFLDQFYKRNPFNEISEKLKILLKKVRGVNFPKEIPLNVFSENTNILLKSSLQRIR